MDLFVWFACGRKGRGLYRYIEERKRKASMRGVKHEKERRRRSALFLLFVSDGS